MNLLWTGTVLGVFLGLIHAVYVFRTVTSQAPRESVSLARGLYYAGWTVGLWILFGSYLLGLWIVAVICHGAARLASR